MKEETTKKLELSFKEYYQSLEEEPKIQLRNVILNECGISYSTFYAKLNKQNFSNLEKKEIERICEESFMWS